MKFGANLEEKIKTNVGIVFISLALIGFVVYSAIPAFFMWAGSNGYISWGNEVGNLLIGAAWLVGQFVTYNPEILASFPVALVIGLFIGGSIAAGL